MLRGNNLQAAQNRHTINKMALMLYEIEKSNRRAEHYCTGCSFVTMGDLFVHLYFFDFPEDV